MLKGILFLITIVIYNQGCYGGPPFGTDDPEPVDFRHWEYYLSSINNFQDGSWSGTSPHFEVNYGLINNVQVHLLLPMNYKYSRNNGSNFGYAYTEVGLKYRFKQESDNSPQVGIFPIVEIPTIKNSDFSNGKIQVYIPVWAQKSWNKLTTYGGAGYWINPGAGNKNWIFAGWEIQYDFTNVFTFGGELYYHSSNMINSKSSTGFNFGGFINFTDKLHLIFSLGHNLTNDSYTSSYIGLLLTI